MTSKGTALITGASAGIGEEFAHQLAAQGYDLILVARNRKRLDAVARDVTDGNRVRVEIMTADLGFAAQRQQVIDRLSSTTDPVDVLINNAGIGYSTPTSANSPEQEVYLLEVNTVAKLALAVAATTAMLRRGAGDIINVSSVAAMGPAWLDSTYGASKAAVLSYTEAMAYSARLRHSKVRMMALCPGDTQTEFNERAGISDATTPNWRWCSAEQVVRCALRDLRRGKVVSVPGVTYRVLAWLLRNLPSTLTARVAGLDFGKHQVGRQSVH